MRRTVSGDSGVVGQERVDGKQVFPLVVVRPNVVLIAGGVCRQSDLREFQVRAAIETSARELRRITARETGIVVPVG